MVASLVTTLRPAQAGGAQAFICDLALGLGARGHEVELYCAAGSEVAGVQMVPIEVGPEVRDALVMPGGRSAAPVAALAEGFSRLFRSLRARGADVASIHAFDAEAYEPTGIRTLHTLHLPPLVPAVVAAAAAIRAPDGLVTVSEAMRRDWAAAGVSGVEVIRNGVPDFDPGTPERTRTALIAGRISPEKGIEDALAAARLAGLPLEIVGDVYDAPYHAARLGHLEITPALSRPELWRRLAAVAVCVLPVQWEEPFGLVAAEAQVMGCPVAGYRRGALPEVVEEGVGGYLAEPGDIDGLARAIRACLLLDRSAVRASGRRRLLIERCVTEYEAMLSR